MNTDEISALIKHFLETEYPSQRVELTATTDLLNDWFIDSLGIVEMVVFLENRFGIDIRRADINASNFRDISTLTNFVAGRLTP